MLNRTAKQKQTFCLKSLQQFTCITNRNFHSIYLKFIWFIFAVYVSTSVLTLYLCSSFDLVTNGGIAVALHFERAPFITQEHTLWLPWGSFFVMDTIIMRHEENDIPSCDLSSFARPSPVVSPAPLTAFAGSCLERRTVVPEIQVTTLHLLITLHVLIYMGRSSKWVTLHIWESLWRLCIKYACTSNSGSWQNCDFYHLPCVIGAQNLRDYDVYCTVSLQTDDDDYLKLIKNCLDILDMFFLGITCFNMSLLYIFWYLSTWVWVMLVHTQALVCVVLCGYCNVCLAGISVPLSNYFVIHFAS